jgi:hypothetical protein
MIATQAAELGLYGWYEHWAKDTFKLGFRKNYAIAIAVVIGAQCAKLFQYRLRHTVVLMIRTTLGWLAEITLRPEMPIFIPTGVPSGLVGWLRLPYILRCRCGRGY